MAARGSSSAPEWVRACETGLNAHATRDWRAAIAHFERADEGRGGEILIARWGK